MSKDIAGVKKLLDYLIQYGGKIISSNDLTPEWIEQARASDRMWVDESGFGFIWEPDIKQFPETQEEVEALEKWYPLEVKLPDSLKSADKIIDEYWSRKKAKEN